MKVEHKKLPFAETAASKKFMAEVQRLIVREIGHQNSQFVSKSNVQIFSHGRSWTYQREDETGFTPQTGNLELQSQNVSISMDRLKANDVTVLPEFVLQISGKFAEAMAKRVIEELQAAVQQTGNTVVVRKGESLADAFLEAVKRSQGSIDSEGNYCPPNITLSPEVQKQLEREIAEKGEYFYQAVEAVKREQEAAVRLREQERLKKYGSGE